MTMSDPLGDLLTRIRNGQRARKPNVSSPASKLRANVLEVLKREGGVTEMARRNRAKALIENFMIAANGVTTRYLVSKNFPTFRRVLQAPQRWDRLMALAEEFGAGYVSSGYRDAVGFIIIILVLVVRPSGLFARAERVG